MKMKRVVSAIAALAMSVSAFAGLTVSAATADDIVPISSTATYWFSDYITAGVAKDDLIADDHFYSPTGNSYAANKGNYEGHLNCLRLKKVQDMLQFEVAKPAEITIYSMSHASRGVVVTSTVPSSEYASYDAAIADTANVIAAQPTSATSFTFTVDAATDFCLSNYGGDFFIAGVGVKILTTDPEISVSPTTSTINLGETLTINATTQNTGDAAIVWSSDNEDVATVADGVVTSVAPGTANITATVTVGGVDYSATCALTVQDVATVTYDISAYACEGTAPEAVTVTKGESVTIPVNNSVYGADSTLTGWTDGSDLYAIGESFTLTEDVTLTPWFEDNKAALGDAETSVTFYFGESNGAQTIAVQGTGNPSAILVEQAVIGDAKIDVKADIDASAGKFNNFKRGDKWAQVNGGTIINVPVLAGSVITMGDIYNDAGTYTIGGVECTGDGGTYTATEDGTVAIVAGAESGSYWESITVTYPKKAESKIDSLVELVKKYDTSEDYEGVATALKATFTITGEASFNHVAFTVSGVTAEDDVTVVSGDGASAVYGIIVENAIIEAAAVTAEAAMVE